MLNGITIIKSISKEPSCIRRITAPITTVGVDFSHAIGDVVTIKSKSPLSEFKQYLKGFKLEGEEFIPHSDNPNSAFMEYFNFRQKVCAAKPGRSKIVNKKDNESFIKSLMAFQDFMKTASTKITKEEYYQILDEIATLMPNYVRKVYPGLREEIVENSGKIFKWHEILSLERKGLNGEIEHFRLYDEEQKAKALKEFVEFTEKLTGKKVLIGQPTRMAVAPNMLGLLNDPASYKDIDYILIGHGTGSSLVKDTTNPYTWKFSDSGKSVWEYIEQNVPKGKRALLLTCEKDGLEYAERKTLTQMYDKSQKYMYGRGAAVSTHFNMSNPVKICESGVREIIGHSYISSDSKMISSFIDSSYGKVKNVYYDL